jgi:hypothetical protein
MQHKVSSAAVGDDDKRPQVQHKSAAGASYPSSAEVEGRLQKKEAAADGARAAQGGMHALAQDGVQSAHAPLPHFQRIQAAFGGHDLSNVKAQVGGPAGEANARMGSLGYTVGDRVGFRAPPDVRLAAHEATHVVQQRAGVHLKDGIGRPGDRYEQHADAVADAVVRGESVEPLLDRSPTGAAAPAALGRRPIAPKRTPVQAQQERPHAPSLQLQTPPKAGDNAAELAELAGAFSDPNYVVHWRALEKLQTMRQGAAFDLILSRIDDPYEALKAHEAALNFFLFYPDLAIAQLNAAVHGSSRDHAMTFILHATSMRDTAVGPAVTNAYRMLDQWMQETDLREGGLVTILFYRRQIETTANSMRDRVKRAIWFMFTPPPGARAFVLAVDGLLERLPTMPDSQIGPLHTDLMAVSAIVEHVTMRLDELHDRVTHFIVDEHVPPDADDIKFINEEVIAPYDNALGQGVDFVALAGAAAYADTAYRTQGTLYQRRKIRQFHATWDQVVKVGFGYPINQKSGGPANASGMKPAADELYNRYASHREALEPRLQSMFRQDAANQQISPQELAEVQRDLCIVQLESAAASDFLNLYSTWEQLEQIEPDLPGDFDDIQNDIQGYANRIHGAIIGGKLADYGALYDDIDFRLIFNRVKREVDTKQTQAIAIQIGILALSALASGGIALLARGGTMLLFGAELVEAGVTGARVLRAVEFVANVASFTLISEGLRSEAFGRPIDWSGMPLKLLENAVMFKVFGLIGGKTAGMFKGGGSFIIQTARFAARQGVCLAAFSGIGVLQELIFRQQLPKDWRQFLIVSAGSYGALAAVGAGLRSMRASLDQRVLTPTLEARFQALAAEEADVLKDMRNLTGAEGAAAEQTLVQPQAEALRGRIGTLSSEYLRLIDFLKGIGAIPEADAAQLTESVRAAAEALKAVTLSKPRVTVFNLERVPGVVPMGDGVTYVYNARGAWRGTPPPAGDPLERPAAEPIEPGNPAARPLWAYREAGFRVERDPRSGEIRVTSPEGELVARLIPNLASSTLSVLLVSRGVDPLAARELVNLPSQYHPALRALPPEVLNELGRQTPERVARLLNANSALQFLRGDVAQQVRYLQILAAADQLLFAETHVHTVGAIPYPELIIRSMVEATSPRQLREAFESAQNFVRAILDLLPAGPTRQAAEQSWGALEPELASFRDRLADAMSRGVTDAALVEEGAQLTDRLASVITLPITSSAEGPMVNAFFGIYGYVSKRYWRGGTAQRIAEVIETLRGQNVAYVELRQGMGKKLEQQLEAKLKEMDALAEPGEPRPDARIILTITRGVASKAGGADDLLAQIQRLRAHPRWSRVIVGVDLSGAEVEGEGAGEFQRITRYIVLDNFQQYRRAIEAQAPDVAAQLRTLLGVDAIAEGERLSQRVEAATGEANVQPPELAELSGLNRRIQDALGTIGRERGQSLAPQGVLGITIHAGEQIAGQPVGIETLLGNVEAALNSGTDRVGHALILGIRFPGGLQRLGFRKLSLSPGGEIWVREVQQEGRPPLVEVYTAEELATLEARRVGAIERAAKLGVTIEANPTSNIVLSGLASGSHPVAEMLAIRSDLRVSVSTDNPAIHGIDVASELALLVARVQGNYPLAVRVFLEGYASRLGARSLADQATLRAQILDGLVRATPAEQRAEVILELHGRYGIGEAPRTSAMITAEYQRALSRFLEAVIY